MTLHHTTPAPDSVDRSATPTMRLGGGLYAAAGVLLFVGLIAASASPSGQGPAWLTISWPLGGLVLLVASVLLAAGVRGDAGLVGPGRGPRAALILSGAGALLLTAYLPLFFSMPGLASAYYLGTVLLSLVSTAVVAVTVLRRAEIAPAARWVFVGLVVIDGVTLMTPIGIGVRALGVIVVGVLLMRGRSVGAGAASHDD